MGFDRRLDALLPAFGPAWKKSTAEWQICWASVASLFWFGFVRGCAGTDLAAIDLDRRRGGLAGGGRGAASDTVLGESLWRRSPSNDEAPLVRKLVLLASSCAGLTDSTRCDVGSTGVIASRGGLLVISSSRLGEARALAGLKLLVDVGNRRTNELAEEAPSSA